MTESEPEVSATGVQRPRLVSWWPTALATRWLVLLLSYFVLLATTGYLAFFQEEFNPQSFMTKKQEEYLAGDKPELQKLVMDTLNADGAAFKARRELAVQSFNVVLGAILGFLSASSVRKDS